MEETEVFYLPFSFLTVHWFVTTIQGEEVKLPFKPLTIREKADILAEYSHLEEKERVEATVTEECMLMLNKSGQDYTEFIDSLPFATVNVIYLDMVNALNTRREQLTEFINEHGTKPIKPSKKKPNKLDPLVNVALLCKETSLSLADIADLDDLSLVSLLAGIGEISTREANSYEEARSKR